MDRQPPLPAYCVAYRTFSGTMADLVESILRSEGVTYRRLGADNPALVGVGDRAIEHRFEVLHQDLDAVTTLLAQVERASGPDAEASERYRGMPRYVRVLTRVGLYGLAAMVLSVPLAAAYRFGRSAGLPTLALLHGGQLFALCLLAGAGVALLPERTHVRAAVLAFGALLFCALFVER